MQGQGEGTVEYYGNTRNLLINRTFYNVEVNLAAGNTLTILSDNIINGNLLIQNGNLSINNNSSITPVNITVYGNVTIESSGRIVTGTAGARHQLNLYGDFTNNGEAYFTNRIAPDYNSEATNGIVDVNFLNISRNQNITCNGVTNFYRIEIDKGENYSYVLNIDATDPANFNLFGFANESHGVVSQLTDNNNAIGLVRGTVRIGNSIVIPVLSSANVYSISENAQLWIDRGTVLKNGNGTLAVNGKLKITNGLLEVKTAGGITFRNNGILNVEGGTINVNQIRSSEVGTSSYGGYVQTGGDVNVLGGTINGDYYVFTLPYPQSVFNMSGGVLTVNTAAGTGGILINSSPENIKVSGGMVIAETNSVNDFLITSTASFWNLSLKNSTSVARLFTLGPGTDIGPDDLDIPSQPLRVLNDFRIWGKESGGVTYPGINFNPGINNVYIGGSFFIENGATYLPVSGGTPPYDAIPNQPTARNTTYFIKTTGTGAVEELYQGNDSNPLEFGNLIIDRTNGYEVRLTSSISRVNESVVLDVNGSASVLSGTLNQNLFTIRTWGAITNNDRMGTWNPGITPSRAQIQLVENPALTLTTTSNAVFGNVQVNVTPPSLLTLSSDVYIERLEYVKGLIYLKAFNLRVDNLWNMEGGIFENSAASSYLKVADSGYSGSSLIFTDGKASDGGLSLRVSANSQVENQPNIINNVGPVTYPVGFTSDGGSTRFFRPAQMVVKNFADDGYVTIRPVMGPLSTLNSAGGEVLQQFWRVSSEGFNTPPTVSFRFYYRNRTGGGLMDLVVVNSPNENSYVPGKVKDVNPYTRLYEPLTDNDIIKNIGPTNTRVITFNGTSAGGSFSPSSNGFTLENTNFTAGAAACFAGSPTHFYSNASYQEWNNAGTWDIGSIGSGVHGVPTTGSIVHIYNDISTPDNPGSRGRISVNASGIPNPPAEIIFEMPNLPPEQSTPENVPRLQFWRNGTYNLGFVRGTGMISYGNTAVVTNGDFGDFGTNPYSYYLFFAGPAQLTSIPTPIPNMMIEYSTNINQSIVVNYDLIIQGDAVVQPLQDVDIRRDLLLGFWQGCTFQFPATGSAVKVTVGRDIDFTRIPIPGAVGNRVLNTAAAAGGLEHTLILKRSIIHGADNNFGINLYGSATRSKAILELQGESNGSYARSSSSVPVLYRILMNKGTNQTPAFSFNNSFTLQGSTNTDTKAITMQNGTLVINNSAIDLNLTTGGSHFDIPASSCLNINQGTVRASGNSGISLDGKLSLSGGAINMSGGDNPIEYSASGNATIDVTGGTLTVGGQIRRSPTSDIGILRYNQTSGSVVAGNNSATVNNRGVFEILNPGSSFSMTGGDLYIGRSQTSPSISAFYFDPSSYNINVAANIHIGHPLTSASQTIGVFAGKPLPKLRVNNASGNHPTAKLEIVPATITNLLQVDAGASFNANGLNLTINGDLTVSGTFVPAGNTTIFNSNGTQTINGGGASVNFYNLDKTTSGSLVLNSGNTPLLISNTLFLRNGTLTDNGNTITLRGNILIDGIHINNGSGDGIVMNGTAPQSITGNGIFGKLTINNPSGVNIPVGNQLAITRSLKMQAGVLNIGRNLLDLGADAVIEEAAPFSTINMIETNISFTDNGLKKTFNSGPQTFTFPMGSNYKYTPVIMNISANGNSTGSIIVKPASEMHPSIVEDTESGVQIVDKDNVLQYYWTMKAEGLTGFSAVARMYYADADIKVTAPYTIADYHTATLLTSGDGTWLKFPKASFDEATKCLIFSFTGTDDAQISGDYTAGAGDETLDGAIPSQVTVYETNGSGNWTTGSIWTPSVSGGPRGGIVKINLGHTIDVTTNYLSSYMAEVDGVLNLDATYGHRLGIVSGSGTIYTEKGELPAGVYASFFSLAGGTLHFGGTDNYDILGNIPIVNNLTLSGSGEKRLPNNNITLNGHFTLSGNVRNYYNRKISVKGNLTRTGGSFEAGTGVNATLALNGTLNQTVSGSFIDNNALNNLEINNINDVNLDGDLEIDRELTLTEGMINVEPGSLLKINYGATVLPSGGTPLAFVNGTLVKEMMNGNSFTFPIGYFTSAKAHGPITLQDITGPAGINDWKASYYFASPTIAGYNTLNFESSISTVSNTEYWKIEAPDAGSSIIMITLDGSSDVASALDDLTNLRIVGWNATNDKWEIVGTGAVIAGTKTSGTVTTTSQVDYDNYTYFTLASIIPVASGTATITSPSTVNICNGSSTTITVNFTGEMPYILTYDAGGTSVTPPAINSSSYDILANPSITTVYTLTAITANGVAGTITGTSAVTVNVNPIPTVNLSRSGSGDICEGASITFTATAGLSNYNFRVNGSTVQNGASNTYITTTLPTGPQSVDVVGTNAGGCSATSSALAVTVNPWPGAAGAISGEASVCRNSTRTYSVAAIPNATSYLWSVAGAGATGSSITNSIDLTFPTAGTAIITVRGVNGCGNGAPSTFNVSVNTASMPGAAGVITGSNEACQGGTGYGYSVGVVANATSYIWSYSGTGATITGTGNSVTIDFAGNATAGNLRVAGTNGCATGSYSPNFSIAINQSPTATIDPVNPSTCSSSPITLTATPAGGTMPYTIHSWTGAGAGSLSSVSIPNPTFSNVTGGNYDLTYTVTDNNGCKGSINTTVIVFQAPVVYAGADATGLCSGTAPIAMSGATATGSYSGNPTWSGSGGTWTQNPNPALATFTPSTLSGSTTATLTLTGANGCSNVTDTKVISWSSIPLQPGNFTVSSSTVCQGQTGVVYTVPNDPMVTTYNWTYTIGSGAVITGTGNSVTVNFASTATSGSLNVTASNSCGTSGPRSIAVTVNIPAVATFSYPGTPYCPTAADPLPAFSGGGVAGVFSSGPGLVFVNTSTGQIDLSTSTPGIYTVTNTIAPAGGCGAVIANSPFEITKDYIWTGTSGTDWNAAGNWSCGVIPGAINSILIPVAANNPILSAGFTGSVNNITISPGASLTLAGTLRVSGTITNSGIFDVSSGIIMLDGSTPQSLLANTFKDNKIKDLTVNNASGVTLLGPLNVTRALYLQNGDLASNGNLTLVSDASGTAFIDGTGTGNVYGNVTMQRYLDLAYGYGYFSSPFQSAKVSEFVPEITLGASFPLLYKYVEDRNYMGTPITGWEKYDFADSVLHPLHGYSVNFSNNTPLTVDVKGIVSNGPVARTLYNHNQIYTQGFSLAGNPYPSAIDWDLVTAMNPDMDGAIYMFEATDRYTGMYSSYQNGVSTGKGSDTIPPMQAFFVHVPDPVLPATFTTATLNMDNSVRIIDTQHEFLKSAKQNRTEERQKKHQSWNAIIKVSAGFTGSILEDPIIIYFNNEATGNFDKNLDAVKLLNTTQSAPNFYSFGNDNSKLAINALPLAAGQLPDIPLGVRTKKNGEVIFRIRQMEGFVPGGSIYLFDALDGSVNDITSSEHRVMLNTGNYDNRFYLRFGNIVTGLPDYQLKPLVIYNSGSTLYADINCLLQKEGILRINTISGQTLFTERIFENGHYEFSLNLKSGIYIVSFVSGDLKFSQKITIVLQ